MMRIDFHVTPHKARTCCPNHSIHRVIMAAAALAVLSTAGIPVLAAQPADSTGIVTRPELWSKVGDGAIRVGNDGLRIEVTSAWAGAVSRQIKIPAGGAFVRWNAKLDGGARLTVKLEGNLHGDGKQRAFIPAWGIDLQGAVERPIDPRAIYPGSASNITLTLIAEGKPGAWVQFTYFQIVPHRWPAARVIPGQKSIPGIDLMPNLPTPYRMLDWKRVCHDFDRTAFNTQGVGQYLPLCAVSAKPDSNGRPYFSQSTYVGDKRVQEEAGESLNSLWAMVSGSSVGIDMRKSHGVDWLAMADAGFCTDKGLNLLTDYRNGPTAENYWYDLQPATAYAMLLDRYPGRPQADQILRTSIDTLAKVHDSLKGADGIPDYDFSGYEYDKGKPAASGSHEPDNAGNAAWLFYLAYRRYGDASYLRRAQECIRFWDKYGPVPFIETGLPFGALAAAQMKAELGLDLPADKYISRCFEFSHEKNDHTTIGADRWGDTDVSGMWEDPANKCYYVESCHWTMLVNVVRYDPSYARAMGKWMLNLANSLRLFFPDQLPPDCQTDWDWKGDATHSIPYERLNWGRKNKALFACSDSLDYNWKVMDLSLYSGAASGLIGGRIDKTSVEGILRIDLLAFDTFHAKAYPTWLYYNPHHAAKTVTLATGDNPADLYDTVSKKFIARNVRRSASIVIPADRAVVAVVVPAGGRVTRSGRKLLVNGVVVDYYDGLQK